VGTHRDSAEGRRRPRLPRRRRGWGQAFRPNA